MKTKGSNKKERTTTGLEGRHAKTLEITQLTHVGLPSRFGDNTLKIQMLKFVPKRDSRSQNESARPA